jgi:RND family efflux transporter MFP subunit
MMPQRFPRPLRCNVPARSLCATLLLGSLLVACAEAPQPAPTPSLTVETVAPRNRELAREVVASGAIAAWEEVAVGVELSGLRVAEVAVEVGDTVKRGDLLLRLDARTLQAQLGQSQASVAQAAANQDVAARRARRTAELAEGRFVSLQDAEQAQLNTAQASLEAARVQLGFTTVRAPVHGVVSARQVQPGQVVAAGGELLRLIREGRLEWRAELAENDLVRVMPGAVVRVEDPTGGFVEGRVRQVSPALDPQRRTGTVYVDLAEQARLRAGMFAAGRIVVGRGAATVIPVEAVVRRDGREYVFVVDGESRARERRIETGATEGTDIEVRAGLREDDRVVARGGGFLGDGDLVRVLEPKAAASPAPAAAKAR